MLIKTIPVGQLETNCYIVTNEETLECVVIDPGDESNTVLDYIESNHLKGCAVMLTHGHFDHFGAADAVADELDVPVYINERDVYPEGGPYYMCYDPGPRGIYYDEGDKINIAGYTFEIFATPGHTAGGVTIKCGDVLFTGDTLFKGSAGRTDLATGDIEMLLASLRKICALPGDYEVYPGHMDATTLERERTFNHFCRTAARD